MRLSGIIIHGEKIGRTLGYPTANIDVAREEGLHAGVYASWVIIEEKKYKGALVIADAPWKVEVHIIDMPPKDMYGSSITIEVKERISDIVAFPTVDALKRKIEEDIDAIKKILR